MDFKYEINPDGKNEILSEHGNSFIALREVKWGDKANYKLELRKWVNKPNGEEQAMKGITFVDEEQVHEISTGLVSMGYGYTDDIINGIKCRENFMPSLIKCLNGEDIKKLDINSEDYQDDEYQDPSSIFE